MLIIGLHENIFVQLLATFLYPYPLIDLRPCLFKLTLSSIRKLHISISCSTALVDLGRSFNFLILYTVGTTPRTGDQPVTNTE
jgi:hypothetical protein